MSLIDAVMDEIGPGHVDAVAQRFGIAPAQARGAIEHALPLLVAAMARHSETDQGAQMLHGALDAHAGLDLGSVLGAVMGGGGAPAGGGLGGLLGSVLGASQGGGGDLIGQIFGARQNQASQGLGQASGLGSHNAAQLMAMLAPVVMAVLARMREQQGAAGVGQILGGDAQRTRQSGGLAGGLLGAVLDRDGDGDVDLSDLMQVGGGLLGGMARP